MRISELFVSSYGKLNSNTRLILLFSPSFVIREVYILLVSLKNQMIPKRILFGFVISAFMIAIAMYDINTSSNATPTGNKIFKVAAGGGNITAPWTVFLPQTLTINVGDSVEWYNPTIGAAEPHTVTFTLDNGTFAGVASPLDVSNKTEFNLVQTMRQS